MSNKIVQLHDPDNNNLYPIVTADGISGAVPVENGGLASTTVVEAITTLLTGVHEYTNTGTKTNSTAYNKEYTVSGNGIIFAQCNIYCDTTNSYGSTYAEIILNNEWIALEYNRTDTSSGASVSANAFVAFKASNGDALKFETLSTKSGTKTTKIRVLTCGCTLT